MTITKKEFMRSNDAKYRDLEGRVTFDFHGINDDLNSFSKDHGIDTDKYKPVAISLGAGENVRINHDCYLHIYCTKVGISHETESKITLIDFRVSVTLQEFLEVLKRFHFIATVKHFDCDSVEVIPAP